MIALEKDQRWVQDELEMVRNSLQKLSSGVVLDSAASAENVEAPSCRKRVAGAGRGSGAHRRNIRKGETLKMQCPRCV